MFPSNGIEMCQSFIWRENRADVIKSETFEEFESIATEIAALYTWYHNDRRVYVELLNKKNKIEEEIQEMIKRRTSYLQSYESMMKKIQEISDNNYCRRMFRLGTFRRNGMFIEDKREITRFKNGFIPE